MLRRPLRFCVTLLALTMLLGGAARAQDAGADSLDQAYEAERQGDYTSAAGIYERLAERGSAEAQYGLGILHMHGLLDNSSDLEALRRFEQAGNQGHAPAMNAYGYMKDVGRGGPRDAAAAEDWFSRAVAKDYTTSMNNLAYLWSLERRNLNEALGLAEEATRRDPPSPHYQDTLGWVLYMQGRYKEALGPLCEAVRLDPREPVLREHYGDALWMAGRRPDAQAEWGEGLRLLENPLELSENGFETLRNFGPELHGSLSDRLRAGLDETGLPPAVEPEADSRFLPDAGCAQLIG